MRKLLILTLLLIVFIAGCSANQFAPGQLKKSVDEIRDFLNEYPNAKIVSVFIGKDDIDIVSLREECGEHMHARDYWKTVVIDPDTNTVLTLWADENNFTIQLPF